MLHRKKKCLIFGYMKVKKISKRVRLDTLLTKLIQKSPQCTKYLEYWQDLVLDKSIIPDEEALLYALLPLMPELNLKAVEQLRQLWEYNLRAKPLGQGMFLGTVGKLQLNKVQLKKQLKSLGVTYLANTNAPQITHLLVGARLKEKEIAICFASKGVKLTENQWVEQSRKLPSAFICNSDNTQQAQVAELLKSNDPANIEIGLQVLQSGGLPPGLLTDVFNIYCFYPDAKISDKAKKLLLQNASEKLQILHLKLKKQWWSPQYDEWIARTELEVWKIYLYRIIYAKPPFVSQECIPKALSSMPEALKWDFMAKILKKFKNNDTQYIYLHGTFDLSTFYDLVYAETEVKSLLIDNQQERLKILPKGISRMKNLSSLNISTALEEFPVELQELRLLKQLIINIVSIKQLDNCFDRGFEALEELSLRLGRIQKLPLGLGSLQKLRKLDLSGGSLKTLPPDLKELKKLEILYINGNDFEEIPKVLFSMKGLKELRLKCYRLILSQAEFDALAAALPDCKIAAKLEQY